MLAQKIFDQVITHLRMQGKRSGNTIHNLNTPKELNDHVLLLVDLQLVHDTYLPVEWEHQFELIARKHKLKYSLPCIPEQMKHLSAADLLKAEQAYADRHEHSSY